MFSIKKLPLYILFMIYLGTNVSIKAAAPAPKSKLQIQLDHLTNENTFSAELDYPPDTKRITTPNQKGALPIEEIKSFLQHLNQDNSEFIVLSLGTRYKPDQIIPSYMEDLANRYPDKKFINYAIDPQFFTSEYVDLKDQQDEKTLLARLQQIPNSNNIYNLQNFNNLKIALFSTFFPALDDSTQELTTFFKILRKILKDKLRRGCIIFFHEWALPYNPIERFAGLMLTYEYLRINIPTQKSKLRYFVGYETVWDPEDTPQGLELYDPIRFNFQIPHAGAIICSLPQQLKDFSQQKLTDIEFTINKTKNVKFCNEIKEVLIDEARWKMKGIQLKNDLTTREGCAVRTSNLTERIWSYLRSDWQSIHLELRKRGKMLQNTIHGFKIVDSPSDE